MNPEITIFSININRLRDDAEAIANSMPKGRDKDNWVSIEGYLRWLAGQIEDESPAPVLSSIFYP